jgi:hypothetical protein
MGAVPGGVNRSAKSSFHEGFRSGHRFDQEPSPRRKPPELSGAKHDIFAATIGGDPEAAGSAGDPASLGKMRTPHHPFAKLTKLADNGRLGLFTRRIPCQANRSPHEPCASHRAWCEFGSVRKMDARSGNPARSLAARSKCLPSIVKNRFSHERIVAPPAGNNRFSKSNF